MVDLHCHVLPELDDGPSSLPESLALCRALLADGITTVVATPHQLGRYEGRNSPAAVRQATARLNEALAAESIALEVLPGGDVRVDERLPEWLQDDAVLTLGDAGHHLLIELPHETVVELQPLIESLSRQGTRVILSHPERNRCLARSPQLVLPWLSCGLLLQVTAGSLMGAFGSQAERMAWHLLEEGLATLVATDSHDLQLRRPCMTIARKAIAARLGEKKANELCWENPRQVLAGAAATNLACGGEGIQ